jgi:mannose-6-phosphate isomerase-like protein (cupin superfamily)
MRGVKRWSEMSWQPTKLAHPGLSHLLELVSEAEAEALDLHLWKVLRERIQPRGAVLPHYHDVVALIHFLHGTVEVHLGEQRFTSGPGDFIIARAGMIHSVTNFGQHASEQVSIFIPERVRNHYGTTTLIDDSRRGEASRCESTGGLMSRRGGFES